MFLPRHDDDVLGRHERRQAINRFLQHRTGRHQGEELFGGVIAAERPEARAAAPRKDSGVHDGDSLQRRWRVLVAPIIHDPS